LARQVVTQLELRRRVLELDKTLAELRESRAAITEAKSKSEELLLNILPAAIAEELKQHGKVIPRHHDAVTILFADFKGFTRLAEAMEPAALIHLLDEYFTKFDELAVAHGMEKLKTIGDAYMCVGGPARDQPHPSDRCLPHGARHAGICRTDEASARQVSPAQLGAPGGRAHRAGDVRDRRQAQVHL